jgi:cyclophilin family peptidyl-prolyl cis-trans isomerase
MKINKRTVISFFIILMFLGSIILQFGNLLWGGNKNSNVIVVLETTRGDIEIKLATKEAPITTDNFLDYVESGFYDGTIFHRVISGFMIQGGGYIPTGKLKPTGDTIVLESNNGLKNKRGTIAMARTSEPNSATSQFFINLVDNDDLDWRTNYDGYAVFGEVVKGMEVVDAIGAVRTSTFEWFPDWPEEDIIITDAYVKQK